LHCAGFPVHFWIGLVWVTSLPYSCFQRKSVFYCISLLLHYHKFTVWHSLWLGIWARLAGWVLCSGSQQAEIKVLAGAVVSCMVQVCGQGRLLFQTHCSVPCGCGTETFRS
jgi:hypothetical protein